MLALLAEAGERDGRRYAEVPATERIKRLRTHAEELRTIADDFSASSAQISVRIIADHYARLADDAEERLTRRSAATGSAG